MFVSDEEFKYKTPIIRLSCDTCCYSTNSFSHASKHMEENPEHQMEQEDE